MTKSRNATSKMRRLGLIGGTSWHSTVEYYSSINQSVNEHFDNNTNPPLVLFNVNQSRVHQCQQDNNWDGVADIFIEAAQALERANVDALSFCANTPHKVYDRVASTIGVPILHIADATAAAVQKRGLVRVGFIGTRYSMEDNFITSRIAALGIDVCVPGDSNAVAEMHRIIQQELTFNDIRPESKRFVIEQLQEMIDSGVEGVVLGCTEFTLMLKEGDLSVPLFDTTRIHAASLVDFVLDHS